MRTVKDGPASPLFTPLSLEGNTTIARLAKTAGVSTLMRDHSVHAPRAGCTCWGVPFEIRKVILAADKPVTIPLDPVRVSWLVFLHTTDMEPEKPNEDGFIAATRGGMRLGVHVADYVFCYGDGTEVREAIRWRFQIGMFMRGWGDNCTQAVANRKPFPVRPLTDQPEKDGRRWGWTQTRVGNPDMDFWVNWLWAWENPHPRKRLTALRVEPIASKTVISAVSAGKVGSQPFRWRRREKAVLRLPRGSAFDPALDAMGLFKHAQLDLGQVISVQPRTVYPNEKWATTCNSQPAEVSTRDVLIEYTAHPEARLHLENGKTVAIAKLARDTKAPGPLRPIAPSTQRVRLRVVDRASRKPVPVRLHVHGEAGEYLTPVDRHRYPNPEWFEDYSVDYVGESRHNCTYMPGETTIDLPLGRVYIEVSRGFEIKPIRKVVAVSTRTKQITLMIEKVLPWRERGWVTADTHVHFLSPPTAMLEGSAEGVNVVNLLASQWGELMTNVGDFDGKTTFGSKEAGGDGEWLVRVGTENRQHVLGHISLLGYNGDIIAPMTTGGPDESALGDPVENLLIEWARLCREQGGLAVFPHFPNPRLENAAALVKNEVDAIEMTSCGYHFGGISPYALSDWYRYLNCGYFVPAVGGTDKMSAAMLLGAIRTYVRLPEGCEFTYPRWMDAVRSGHTFVTFGPLIEFAVEGKPAGTWVKMNRTGGTVDVTYEVASVTVPTTRVELVVNGEIRERRKVSSKSGEGHWSVKIDKSSWIALLVRGQYKGQPEYIAAHSSPVMVPVEGTPFMSAADALTILEQIEGAMTFLDTLGTRAETKAYKRMRMILTAAYRTMHNRMHAAGHDHTHTAMTDHKEHH